MSSLDPIPYSDAQLRSILQRVRTVAMVGASSNWNRPSYFVMKYLQGKGYRVIPVNPGIAGETLIKRIAVALQLEDVPARREGRAVARRVPGRARCELVALGQRDVAPAFERQVIERAAADRAAADDQHPDVILH